MRDHQAVLKQSMPEHTRVIALVDNHCGSDCEGLVMSLSQLPDTVIAGTGTSGTIGFTQPGIVVLPRSRVPIMIAQGRDDAYGDGRSEAGYGLTVDVLLPTDESQGTDSIKALAEALLKS
jgi:hypothetical protein